MIFQKKLLIFFFLASILPLLGVSILITNLMNTSKTDSIHNLFYIGQNLQQNILIISLIMSILLILFAIYFSYTLSKSILKLIHDLEKIGNGNIEIDLGSGIYGDFSVLGKELKNVVQKLREDPQEGGVTKSQLEKEKAQITNERNILSEIISGFSDGVIAIDNNKNILLFNKAADKLAELTAQSALGKNIDEVFHLYDKDDKIASNLYLDQSEKIAQRFKEKGLEIKTSLNSNNLTISLLSSSIRLVDKSTGWIITFQDISDEVASEVLKIDFVSMAAHELRTPLTSVRGFAAILKMEKEDQLDDEGKIMLERLMISGSILGNLIENLLNVTRIGQNRFTITPVPVDLTSTIKDTVNNLTQQATFKKQKLEVQINDKLPIVSADVFRITQVVTNLVANAIHYTGDGGSIKVIAEGKDKFLQVSVTDNGEGIPAEALPKMFTKFFRVSGNVIEGAKGTGLGLFITKAIIELHKGKIWVTSEQGKGSTFTFILPVVESGV